MIVWKPIPSYSGYEVSSDGLVRSIDRISIDKNGKERKLKGQLIAPVKRNGYIMFKLGKYKSPIGAHRLVAEAFLGPAPDFHDVCHIDGSRDNNHFSNLRYDTRSGNILDSVIHHNTHFNAQKTHCPRNHRLEMPNLNPIQLNKNGGRYCLACTKAGKYNRRGRKLSAEEYQDLSDRFYDQIMNSN